MPSRTRFTGFVCAGVIAVALVAAGAASARAQETPSTAEQMFALISGINAALVDGAYGFEIDKVDYVTSADSNEAGQTVLFRDRGNKQIGAHYIPGDPRRGGFMDIAYLIDGTEGAVDGLTQAQTDAAVHRAMTTWDNVNCSTIPITNLGSFPIDFGVVEFILGFGGLPFFLADVTHAGWLPAGVFPPNVIAATFTFIWLTGPGGPPSDVDHDGRLDTAFSEILYNDAFTWRINANIDVETVALHESGHGLSQGHFGAAFRTLSNGKLHFAPRAVMNAAYSGIQQQLTGTDNAGHCGLWASWPH